jgi:hypothetical protein
MIYHSKMMTCLLKIENNYGNFFLLSKLLVLERYYIVTIKNVYSW